MATILQHFCLNLAAKVLSRGLKLSLMDCSDYDASVKLISQHLINQTTQVSQWHHAIE